MRPSVFYLIELAAMINLQKKIYHILGREFLRSARQLGNTQHSSVGMLSSHDISNRIVRPFDRHRIRRLWRRVECRHRRRKCRLTYRQDEAQPRLK